MAPSLIFLLVGNFIREKEHILKEAQPSLRAEWYKSC